MKNFPQSFEPVGSDSILEQFIQLKNYVNDALSMFEDNVDEILDSNDFVQTKVQNLTNEQKAQARENIGAGASTINVVDNLDSSSSFDALSANQGRVLNEKINTDVESLRRDTTIIFSQLQNQVDDNIEDISELFQQSARALKTPMTTPFETEIVGVDTSNSQIGITVGDGIKIENGTIKGISIKELWKNNSITSSFPQTTITLNSADYDFLLTIFAANTSDNKYENSSITKKGNNISINAVIASSASPYIYVVTRSAVRNSDTSYTFNVCSQATPSGTTTANQRLIPKYIYGIKVV